VEDLLYQLNKQLGGTANTLEKMNQSVKGEFAHFFEILYIEMQSISIVVL